MADLRAFQWSNFARSTLQTNVTAEATSLQIDSNDASNFPLPGADEIFSVILSDAADSTIFEVVYCTSRSGGTLTVERGKESTTARAWAAGSTVIHTLTVGFLEQLTFPASSPSAVTLSAVEGDGVVELSWTASTPSSGDEIESYKVFKSVDGGSYTQIATVDADDPREYDDTAYDIASSNQYYVVATAILGGDSAASNVLMFGGLDYFPLISVGAAFDGGQTSDWVIDTPAGADIRFESLGNNHSRLPLAPELEKPTGKYYYEIYVEKVLDSPPNTGVGMVLGFSTWACSISSSSNFVVGAGTDGLTYFDGYSGATSGRIQIGSGSFVTISGARLLDGDTVNVAIDYDNEKVWFGRNGTWLGTVSQDPETNTGGYWPTDTTWNGGVNNRPPIMTYAPWFALGYDVSDSDGEKVQFRFSEDYWQYTPPTGFSNELKLYSRVSSVPSSVGGFVTGNSGADAVIDDFAPGIAMVTASPSAVATNPQVRAPTARNSGKYYFEIACIATSDLNDGTYGIVPNSASFDGIITGVGFGVGIDDSGRIRSLGNTDMATYGNTEWFVTVDSRTEDAVGSGDVLMFAVDLDNDKMWFGLNGTWFNSYDPAANTGGIAIPAGSDWKPVVNTSATTTPWLFNCGGNEFKYTPPSGFDAWEAS